MKDRQPYPGKEGMVKLTLVDGQVLEGKLEMADDPLDPGDPLNKATLLKDATAALFGLGSDALPDNVLSYLGKYAMHWWRRRKVSEVVLGEAMELDSGESYPAETIDKIALTSVTYTSTNGTIFIYDSCGADDLGNAMPLDNNETIYVSYNGYNGGDLDKTKGKYCVSVNGSVVKIGNKAVPKRGTRSGDANCSVWMSPSYPVTVKQYPWEYVQSVDREAYPDSGEKGGYEYVYVGVPFEKAAEGPRIASGYFVGTGAHNKDNPNSIKFDFKPLFVIVQPESDLMLSVLVMVRGVTATGMNTDSGTSSAQVQITWEHTTVSWYNEGLPGASGSPTDDDGTKYYYFAVGF